VADVVDVLGERIAALRTAGVSDEHIVVDPGPDFAKTAAQTVEVLRALDRVVAFGRPVLLALSRKDFIGVITGRPPKERLAGTLAAIATTTRLAPASILRVHDVRETREFLDVLDVLDGRRDLDPDAGLDKSLRWQARVAPEST
jgi:dihydropteroate synthase